MKIENQSKFIQQLAEEFSTEFNNLSITVLPNGDIVNKEYLIKQEKNNSWALYSIQSSDFMHQFYLKSCALLASYFYNEGFFNLYREIQTLDRNYWRNYYDSIIYKHHLKNVKDIDNKMILLNRLECAESDATLYKKKISRMFKQSFV